MTGPSFTVEERSALGMALHRSRDAVAKQRAITEKSIGEGRGGPDHAETLNRLAYFDEVELAALDSLATKFGVSL